MALAPDTFIDFALGNTKVITNICTRQRGENGYTLPKRTVSDYNLIFVTLGKVIWVVEEHELVLTPGCMAIVPPYIKHKAYSITKQFDLLSVHIEMRLAGDRNLFEILIPPKLQQIKKQSALDNYLRQAQLEFDRSDSTMTRLIMQSWGRIIGLELLRDNASRKFFKYHPINQIVSEVMNYLRKSFNKPLRLSILEKYSGYSGQYLNRLFKDNIGITPLQYLNRLRMEAAASRISNERKTIQYIARQVGFDDPYYFSRAFKKYFGLSPEQYRREN